MSLGQYLNDFETKEMQKIPAQVGGSNPHVAVFLTAPHALQNVGRIPTVTWAYYGRQACQHSYDAMLS